MSEYKAEGEAERAKTERLRALRLAREAAQQEEMSAGGEAARIARRTAARALWQATAP